MAEALDRGIGQILRKAQGFVFPKGEDVGFLPAEITGVKRLDLQLLGDVGDDVALNQILLAYASDYSLLGTAMRPHGVSWASGVQTASLDHILWFHRPTNFARWHLYVQDSPSASGARGFNRGGIYREDGILVASAAQEGLIRKRD